MRSWQVSDVMTTEVATVGEHTPYREIIDLVTSRHVSAVPVVDDFRRVLGVVSEADLLHKIELIGQPHERRTFESRKRRTTRLKADAAVAKDLMTAPAVIAFPNDSIVAAARLMDEERVKRLPVTDALGRLVGIVSRSDLLKVHLRPDADIHRDVTEEVLHRILAVGDGVIEVSVDRGVVTLTGRLERRSVVDLLVQLVGKVSGVVEVVDNVTFEVDDALMAGIGPWPFPPT